ncbi:chymotrypsin-like elastase family member 2A [Aedes albopictus]|uniref:Peptidase S1 domain-containing protein n=1 Tax=Aedes albopictus TaxID=7160 RepID=A0ABM1Z122_AEDAL
MRSNIILTLVLNFTVAAENPNPNVSSCGTTIHNIQKPLIVKGVATGEPGRWPWHAAIWHRVSRKAHAYVCGGTLLSDLYILTAGHCVSKDGNALNERLFTVQLGSVKQNLLLSGFPVQNKAVAEVFLHEEFSSRDFRADIGLLALKTRVDLNEYVRPICLPMRDLRSDFSSAVGRMAVTVGFGMTESGDNSDDLRQLNVSIVDYVTCLQSNREVFGRSLSEGIICAGAVQGGTVCNGDSGGGLYTEEADGRWVIRGVTSFTAQRGWDDSSCSLKDYSAFVNVSFYEPWIRYVMENDQQEGFFHRNLKDEKIVKMKVVHDDTPEVSQELRLSDKKCREYKRKGLVVTGLRGPGHIYLQINDKPMGLAYYLNDRYALTTANLARNCMNAVCQTILGKKVQQVILHPKFTGSRDFNVALIVIPPATEPFWCLSPETSPKIYFENRQLRLNTITAVSPSWMEFELDSFLPTKMGSVVYNERREIVGLMQNPAGEPIVMTNTSAVLDWIESVVWNEQ